MTTQPPPDRIQIRIHERTRQIAISCTNCHDVEFTPYGWITAELLFELIAAFRRKHESCNTEPLPPADLFSGIPQ